MCAAILSSWPVLIPHPSATKCPHVRRSEGGGEEGGREGVVEGEKKTEKERDRETEGVRDRDRTKTACLWQTGGSSALEECGRAVSGYIAVSRSSCSSSRRLGSSSRYVIMFFGPSRSSGPGAALNPTALWQTIDSDSHLRFRLTCME